MELTSTEMNEIIENGIKNASQELVDNGKSLNLECDHRNGDSTDTDKFAQQIDNNELNLDSNSRLKNILGIV